jgi:hypothetical protein
VASLVAASSAWANHPVLVEGNCDSPVPGTTIVAAGTCGDFDGDTRIGTAEDTDGADRIFGTINAALGPGTGAAANTGANQNGMVTIVTSGRFAETVFIGRFPGDNPPGFIPGNVTLQAAPGVEAIIDAVLQGDPAGGNNSRQAATGIVIEPQTNASNIRIALRNLTIRNFAEGIRVTNGAHVSMTNVRVENNLNYGIRVRENGTEVVIDQSKVTANGFRIGTASPTPSPGHGIVFDLGASGAVYRTEVSGNFGVGIGHDNGGTVIIRDVYLFDNNPDLINIAPE